jgi:ubiquinone/menaquinone biosynthesis C-methylase UbiE
MKKHRKNFDWLANYYDLLTKMVFGKALNNSQQHFLHLLPQGCKILVVGGGSGQMLKHFFETNPTGSVWFVEVSEKMLLRAKENVPRQHAARIQYIYGTETSLPQDQTFDVIVTNFFLDLFPEEQLTLVCYGLSQRLHKSGLWLASDFIDAGNWWQKFMLWIMYRFFVTTCGISANRLPDWEKVLGTIGVVHVNEALFYRGFVKSAVFKKKD